MSDQFRRMFLKNGDRIQALFMPPMMNVDDNVEIFIFDLAWMEGEPSYSEEEFKAFLEAEGLSADAVFYCVNAVKHIHKNPQPIEPKGA